MIKKYIAQSKTFDKAFEKAMNYAPNFAKHYMRFWANNKNELIIDYGSHTSFIYIKTNDLNEDINQTLIKHQTKGEN